ncbi:hypothetical protein [Parafrankia discariae]|uniref:hypothetical protein n=1 Tax=Parafrankia discariae TaxID=365528 RepID=UPI0012B69F0A|nr:hypothetical protein [Parafrankia discariae]
MIFRLAFGVDLTDVSNQLAALGVTVPPDPAETPGAESIVGIATPAALVRAAEQPWLIGIEESRQSYPR